MNLFGAAALRAAFFLSVTVCFATPHHAAAAAKYSSLTSGTDHNCVLMDQLVLDRWERRAVCWGRNSRGQLGNQTGDPNHDYSQAVPTAVGGLNSYPTQLSAGDSFTCVLFSTGAVQCWGDNFQGALGRYDWGIPSPWPTTYST